MKHQTVNNLPLFKLSLLSICCLTNHTFATSHITQVTVFPGSAAVERVATADRGVTTISFACLPAGVNVQSLQMTSDADIRLGEMRVDTVARNLSNCAIHPLDAQITSLEDQKAALQAEFDALDMVKGYLKGFAAGDNNAAPTSSNKNMGATVETLRRSGQDTLLRQHQLNRKLEALDKTLNPLLAERNRSQKSQANVVNVTASIYAPHTADVHLNYQVHGPSWQPAYRAMLDTAKNSLKIERQALVVQATGEDWNNTKLMLSTGQPRANAVAPIPSPWQFDIYKPEPAVNHTMAMYAPAPAVMAPMMAKEEAIADEAPTFDVALSNNEFSTEFSIPNLIDVPSNGQKVAFALGQIEQPANLLVRTSPRVDSTAYLLANVKPPEGVWPTGQIQLYRDNAFVGTSYWQNSTDNDLELSFGQDEQVRITTEPVRSKTDTTGFTGSRTEKQIGHAYVIQNRHSKAITLQVLEAAPTAINGDIKISHQFNPKPTTENWHQTQGLMLWQQTLDAGKSTRITADYSISSPKDANIIER